MQDFRKLVVWQRARRLTKSVYDLTVAFPSAEEFGLKAQMRRAAVSICANIAEGCGRRGDADFRRFLDVAMGSACELECEMTLSWDLAFITESTMGDLTAAVVEIKKMLTGLSASICGSPVSRGGARVQSDRGSSREVRRSARAKA